MEADVLRSREGQLVSDWNRRFILGVGGSVFVGLLVFAAIVLPGGELSPVRFAVGVACFLFTAWGLSVLVNRLIRTRR